LLDAYPGQIRFVYRNLPLTSIHPAAMPAAGSTGQSAFRASIKSCGN
jgi:hypothetical protein